MKIERVIPKPPPEFTLTFTQDEGWAVVGALRAYVDRHPDAASSAIWRTWAVDLDKELRR